MSDASITTALLSILNTSLPVAWPATKFSPPSGEEDMWLRVQEFPNEPDELSWNRDGSVMCQGILQIEVHFKEGTGHDGQRRYMDAVDEAESIMQQYSKGTRADGVGVFRRPWRSAVIRDDYGFYIPVSVAFQGII